MNLKCPPLYMPSTESEDQEVSEVEEDWAKGGTETRRRMTTRA